MIVHYQYPGYAVVLIHTIVFHRQVCARNLPDSIRLLRDENKDVEHVMKVLVKLAEDSGTVQHGVYSYISC